MNQLDCQSTQGLNLGHSPEGHFFTEGRKKTWAVLSIQTSFESIRVEDKLIEICRNSEVSSPYSDQGLGPVTMAIELAFESDKAQIPTKTYHLLCDLAWALCFDYKSDGANLEMERIEKNVKLLVHIIFEVSRQRSQSEALKELGSLYQENCSHLNISALDLLTHESFGSTNHSPFREN